MSSGKECCKSPEIGEEDDFYVCLNCGTVHGRIHSNIYCDTVYGRFQDDSSRNTFIQEEVQKILQKSEIKRIEIIDLVYSLKAHSTIIRGSRDALGNELSPKYILKFNKLAKINESLDTIIDSFKFKGRKGCCDSSKLGLKDGFIVCLNCGWIFTDDILDELEDIIHIVEEIECYTFGVKIDNDNIVGLGLFGCGLKTLPESFGELMSLQELSLEWNLLSSLPESIGNLNSLQNLWLGSNQLTSLPESIGNLNSLQNLWLGSNQLTSLPESIGNLNSLQNLWLGGNQLTSLPESIGNLNSLHELWLEDNHLTSLPESIENLKSFQTLAIRNNPLRILPKSIVNLKSLKEIIISSDLLTCLPESLKDRRRIVIQEVCRESSKICEEFLFYDWYKQIFEECCESPEIHEESGFYVCLNCGTVLGRIH